MNRAARRRRDRALGKVRALDKKGRRPPIRIKPDQPFPVQTLDVLDRSGFVVVRRDLVVPK
ncbi:MAG: hypothetical protein WD556_11315 [Actinomycetota bacterium]